MKNNILIFIAIFLSAVSAYLYFAEERGTIRQELKDFAVDDTASITKIFLADKVKHSVTLTRIKQCHLEVDNKYRASKDLVDVLIKTIKTIEVKSPVARDARDNVIKRLSTGAIKVEIYQGEDTPSKVYYVGGATKSTMGTYMLLENSTEPFIMHIPYFYGLIYL